MTNKVSYGKLTQELDNTNLSLYVYLTSKDGWLIMTLNEAVEGKEYIIKEIVTDDEELDAFLFSLGCYAGEGITVVSRRKGTCVVSIKDGRYSIDNELAEAILI